MTNMTVSTIGVISQLNEKALQKTLSRTEEKGRKHKTCTMLCSLSSSFSLCSYIIVVWYFLIPYMYTRLIPSVIYTLIILLSNSDF